MAKTPKVRWDRDDIKYALAKKGYTLSRLAREKVHPPVAPASVAQILRHGRSQRIEQAIADVIGVPVKTLWPDRKRASREGRQVG